MVQVTVTDTPVAVQDLAPAIRLLVLNRPEARNALNTAMAHGIAARLAELAADRSVRVVVVTGAGDKAFCAGADLKERREMAPQEWQAQHAVFEAAFAALRDFPRPIFCAVNGVALGGGCEIALNTDFALCSDSARFGLPEVRLGIIPGGGGTQHLARRIPRGIARQMLVTGEPIDANAAFLAGLVSSVHPSGELLDAALRVARTIAANSPAAVREVRAAMRDGESLSIEDAMRVELDHYERLVDHPDRYEGIAAWGAGRSPRFEDPE